MEQLRGEALKFHKPGETVDLLIIGSFLEFETEPQYCMHSSVQCTIRRKLAKRISCGLLFSLFRRELHD